MSPRTPYVGLSKSRFLSGAQCHLRLWYDTHNRDLAPPVDDVGQFVFDTGHEVGELACQRYPGGHLIEQDFRHFDEAIAETRRLLDADQVPALFEAAFEHRGVVARADVLERLPDGGWRMIEVKSTTRVKEVFLLDVAIQLWVLRGAGVDVRDACVLTLDNRFVRTAEPPDPNALFRLHTVLDDAEAMLEEVDQDVRTMVAMLSADAPPMIETGEHCHQPYQCPYFAHCSRNAPQPDHGLHELPRLSAAKRDELEKRGIIEVRDVPPSFPMSFRQHLVRRAVTANARIIRGDLAATLGAIEQPVRHLDFETFAPAIPRFVGTKPYQGIPFLFSVHAERPGRKPRHEDYLHEGDDDPRPMLAERLTEALGKHGSICVYSRFERRVIQGLIETVPEHGAALRPIIERLVDLLAIVRRHVYHPLFRGSYSLKAVLPALTGKSYEDLAITDGQLAAVRYATALGLGSTSERQQVFDDLRAYCARDTLATLELKAALRASVADRP